MVLLRGRDNINSWSQLERAEKDACIGKSLTADGRGHQVPGGGRLTSFSKVKSQLAEQAQRRVGEWPEGRQAGSHGE